MREISSIEFTATRSPRDFRAFSRIAVRVFCLAWILVSSAAAQPRPWMPDPDEGGGQPPTAFSTGRTTGHIADLVLTNNGQTEATAVLGPFLIPSNGKDQPYIVPGQTEVVVAAGATVTVPIYGYCADIHRPPVPAGETLPAMSEWIEIDEIDFSDDWVPAPGRGWVAIDEPAPGAVEVLVPGTDTPLGHTIDLDRHPAEAAPLLLAAAIAIDRAYDALDDDGAVTTPFAGNPDREREAVIQQTFWIFAAGLTGAAYKLEDFRRNTIEQFEDNTGQDFAEAPEETRERVDQGVHDFWNTFQAVGVEAKVLPSEKPVSEAAGDSAQPDSIQFQAAEPHAATPRARPAADARARTPEKPRCKCNELSFRVTVAGPGGQSWSTTYTDDRPDRGAERSFAEAIEILRPRDESDLTVTIDQIRCGCSCEVEVESADGESATETQTCDRFFPDQKAATAGEGAGEANIRVVNSNRGDWTGHAEDEKGKPVRSQSVTGSSFSTTYKLKNEKPGLDAARTPFEHELAITLKLVCGGNEACRDSPRCGRKYRITIKETTPKPD